MFTLHLLKFSIAVQSIYYFSLLIRSEMRNPMSSTMSFLVDLE